MNINQRVTSGSKFDEIAEQHNYRFADVMWLRGHNLPKPMIWIPVPLKDGRPTEVLFSFLPCNPAKQHLYPNFWGYCGRELVDTSGNVLNLNSKAAREKYRVNQYGVETNDYQDQSIYPFTISPPKQLRYEAQFAFQEKEKLEKYLDSINLMLPAVCCLVDICKYLKHEFPINGKEEDFFDFSNFS